MNQKGAIWTSEDRHEQVFVHGRVRRKTLENYLKDGGRLEQGLTMIWSLQMSRDFMP